jgi:hypothetical protein
MAASVAKLPPRYEIRELTSADADFIKAIVIHTNMFYSPIWPNQYPEDKTARVYRGFAAADYLIQHQIDSGHSFGVFDTEYRFKREESKPHGKLYWDLNDTSADKDKLAEQMDFPLMSVAMSYDGINAIDMARMGPLIECLPTFGNVYHTLEVLDPRPPESWKATGPHQVLMRNATSTRHEAEGKGLMKALAQFLMNYAYEQGFRGIQIECAADAVTYVWSNPPKPYKGTIISEFHTDTLTDEVEENGIKKQVKPFLDTVHQRCTKVYCDLRPTTQNGMNGHA